ncbi:hypothetical protein GCM10009677_40870 [Sphaerisporangium rubeum]|uniref:DUF2231 domain-containing protein n=1 Tax=Sphaerisporangium rubeum TaxID=321317 RepID=A0A7X0IDU8_9ACTN|nr:DUF2231 domain-containing protein [Sphaerisporangium rubeum]MBB6473430.1 hypothetical protein [Sphaerisporangium rubeum]
MFDQIFGLPAHPLIVHTAVIFIPLLAVGSVVFGVVPRLRPRLGWAVVLLAVVSPIAAFVAKESGEALFERNFGGQAPDSPAGAALDEHMSYANPLLLSALGLGVAALLLVYSSLRLGKTVTAILTVVTVVLAVVAAYYTVRSGHTGAIAVWS